MHDVLELTPVAHIRTDFPTKFGLPRQSGHVDALEGQIVFEPDYRDPNALRGLEGYSHVWLIWGFSESFGHEWSPTVRPPRLGGNVRMGVFATRSPFRPNPVGLSLVRISDIRLDGPDGPTITVSGIDMMDCTPIYDIKPYVPHADCRPDAADGFAGQVKDYAVEVVIPETLLDRLPANKLEGLVGLLKEDPRPGYKREDDRPFGITYAGCNVRFTVNQGILTVIDIHPESEDHP